VNGVNQLQQKEKMMLIMIIDCENIVLLSMLVLFCLDSDAMKVVE
jgi:hypothetical protein